MKEQDAWTHSQRRRILACEANNSYLAKFFDVPYPLDLTRYGTVERNPGPGLPGSLLSLSEGDDNEEIPF